MDTDLQSQLHFCAVGTRIWFAGEKKPYRVRARSSRYLVCTKPFNPRHTVLYTVVDLDEKIRGTENLIFCAGAETDENCVEMVERLHGIMKPATPKEVQEIKGMKRQFRKMCKNLYSSPTEVSHRNRIPLNVIRVKNP